MSCLLSQVSSLADSSVCADLAGTPVFREFLPRRFRSCSRRSKVRVHASATVGAEERKAQRAMTS